MIRHSQFFRVRQQLERAVVTPGWPGALFEFSVFVFKQGWACLFGALMLFGLLVTHFWWPADTPIHRYDALTLYAVAVQAAMLGFRLETPREASVILIFHVVGTVMELFKTAAGSWIYPEAAVLRVGGVPLFSGFMYAAVGSYIARTWRDFDFRFTQFPPIWTTWLLAVAIYVNFFTHHWVEDVRWLLFGITVLLFWRCRIWFRPLVDYRSMPLLAGFGLVALFIWLAENIGTFTRAWSYPSQSDGWHMVPLTKFGSWYLLMIISFVLVSLVSPAREPDVSREDSDPVPRPTPVRQKG